MAQDTTRRERRAAARKQQILDAAVKIFAEKGYHRATTKEIAEAADVAEGTIYTYFDSKDDLLIAIITRLADLAERSERMAHSVERDPGDFFTEHFTQRMKLILPNYHMLLAVLPEILSTPELRQRYYDDFLKPATAMVEHHIQERLELGQLRPVDAPLAARSVTALLMGFQMLMLLGDPVVQEAWQQPEHLVQTLTMMIVDGLRRP